MTGHNPYLEMLAYRSELTADKEQRLREHLEGCHDCRQVAEAYALQSSMLRSMPLVDPPPALRAAVLNRLREAPPRRAWLPRIAFMLSPVAAALVVVVAALAFLTRSHDTTHQTASGPATVMRTHQTPTAAVRAVPPTKVIPVHRGGHNHHRVKPATSKSTPGQAGGSVPTVPTGGPFVDNSAPILSQRLPPTPVIGAGAPIPTPARVAASVYSAQRNATVGHKQATSSAPRSTSMPLPTPTVPGLSAAAPPPPIRAAQPVTPQPTPPVAVAAASTPIPAVPPSIVPVPASPQPVFSSPGPQPTPTP